MALAIILLLSSCEQSRDKRIVYYPVDSLLNAQTELLISQKASVRKISTLDTLKTQTEQALIDEAAWKRELEIYFDLEAINHQSNSQPYIVEDNVPDMRSNLKIRTYTLRDDLTESDREGFSVEYLKIYYEGKIQNIRRIEAKYAKSHTMYKSERHLTMYFDEIRRQPVLTSYSFHGGQKILLGDSVHYDVHAEVLLP